MPVNEKAFSSILNVLSQFTVIPADQASEFQALLSKASYNSILRGKPSNLYIQALKDSEVLLINYHEWLKLANTHCCWQIVLRKITEGAYLQKEKRESDLLFYNAETRYVNFTNEFPELTGHINQHHIASFLGMSPETLSRINKLKIDKCQ